MIESASSAYRIYLARHAHAAWPLPGMRDFDRPLDETGLDEAARLGRLMSANGYQPSRIICSPAARCMQTLEVLRDYLANQPEVSFHEPLYSGSYEVYLGLIAAQAKDAPQSLLLVGHNPMIEETAHAMLASDAARVSDVLDQGFPTAGLLVAECSGPQSAASGKARLTGLLSPIDA